MTHICFVRFCLIRVYIAFMIDHVKLSEQQDKSDKFRQFINDLEDVSQKYVEATKVNIALGVGMKELNQTVVDMNETLASHQNRIEELMAENEKLKGMFFCNQFWDCCRWRSEYPSIMLPAHTENSARCSTLFPKRNATFL